MEDAHESRVEIVPDDADNEANPLSCFSSGVCDSGGSCLGDMSSEVFVGRSATHGLVIGNTSDTTVQVGAYKLHIMQMQIDGLKKYLDAQHTVIKELWADRGKQCIGCETTKGQTEAGDQ